jgi:hypothetical protein
MGLEKDREHLLIVTGAAEQRLIARVETGGHLGAGLNWSAAESARGADADDQRASAPGEFLIGRQRSMARIHRGMASTFFFRFRTRPLSMTTSFSYPDPSTSIDANRGSSRTPSPPGGSAAGGPAPRDPVLYTLPRGCQRVQVVGPRQQAPAPTCSL